MNKKILQITFVLITILISSCSMLENTFKYADTTKELITYVIDENFNKAITKMNIADVKNEQIIASYKKEFSVFREKIINTFGKEIEISFMKSEKTWSTNKSNETPPNSTKVLTEIKDDKQFGILETYFDDNSGKIISIVLLNVTYQIPNMNLFWPICIVFLIIPGFNIYTIIRIYRSNVNKKWLKYLSVLIFNIPAISYNVVNGFSFHGLNFQILLGISIGLMGYIGTYCTIGIPLGSIYWNIKLNKFHKDNNQTKTIEPKKDIEVM